VRIVTLTSKYKKKNARTILNKPELHIGRDVSLSHLGQIAPK